VWLSTFGTTTSLRGSASVRHRFDIGSRSARDVLGYRFALG